MPSELLAGEPRVEIWVDGKMVKSQPVVLTAGVVEIDLPAEPKRGDAQLENHAAFSTHLQRLCAKCYEVTLEVEANRVGDTAAADGMYIYTGRVHWWTDVGDAYDCSVASPKTGNGGPAAVPGKDGSLARGRNHMRQKCPPKVRRAANQLPSVCPG